MLVQHIQTERLFRTVFDDSDFTNRNVIAAEIEKVIRALTSRSFNRSAFLKRLDYFYVAIEAAAQTIDDFAQKQTFLNTVYERFFQGFSKDQADTHGIVYTPQPIVDFMVASVDEVLQQEFGLSLSSEGVQILDPATGTGNFIVNILRRINRRDLRRKYHTELFANEIMLLPYYIASLNIEHAYYDLTGEYEPFEGICFTDTLDLADAQQLSLFAEENTERVQRQKDAEITVVIGNPPYNVGQMSENENNKNRRYKVVDRHIREAYAAGSRATLKNQLYDAYVKFFRWATDRLQGRDGIVCFVSNNSFVDQLAFDGMRKHLLQDFNHIYHLDLHGNVRKNPKLSGTTHNVFGIQVGVGITIAIRNSSKSVH
jgi:predicted helicase